MAAKRINEPIEPMTLGNMRANGVRSLDVSCWQCHHQAIMSADPWSDDVPVPTFGPRMVCTRCGIIGADARPYWQEQPARETPDWRAMAMSPRKAGLDPDQLRALRMVAQSHFGCTQSVLLAHGLTHEILTEIVDKGLAKATPGTVRIGPSQRAIKVTWLTITATGRQALADT
jgi:hypothetical protein